MEEHTTHKNDWSPIMTSDQILIQLRYYWFTFLNMACPLLVKEVQHTDFDLQELTKCVINPPHTWLVS